MMDIIVSPAAEVMQNLSPKLFFFGHWYRLLADWSKYLASSLHRLS